MSLNDSLSEVERSKLAVWDYPVSDKYTKIWQAMREAKCPDTLDDAVDRVRRSKSSSEGFAYVGKTVTKFTLINSYPANVVNMVSS
jgi:ionotropic glutamate receptor